MSARMTRQEALELWKREDVFSLGKLAHARRMSMHPGSVVTYIVDRNINYTNVCVSECRFCAFFRRPGAAGAYVLGQEELARKVAETEEMGGYQILLQGGMNPDLELSFYTDMLAFLKEHFPAVAVHGFSPPEIHYLTEKTGMTAAEIIAALRTAGLDSIPGGGAEILVDRVRSEISPNKCGADRWLEIMETAHAQGMRTTATMMFGHIETLEERLLHLERIREVQDRTGGFTAFIPWTFQPANTRLEKIEVSSVEYLKFLALSRLFLDNVPNIQASWVTQGPMIGQLALKWGANDFGSTMIEENVVAAADVRFRLPEPELRRLIEDSGFQPRRRTMEYRLKKTKAVGSRTEN